MLSDEGKGSIFILTAHGEQPFLKLKAWPICKEKHVLGFLRMEIYKREYDFIWERWATGEVGAEKCLTTQSPAILRSSSFKLQMTSERVLFCLWHRWMQIVLSG